MPDAHCLVGSNSIVGIEGSDFPVQISPPSNNCPIIRNNTITGAVTVRGVLDGGGNVCNGSLTCP